MQFKPICTYCLGPASPKDYVCTDNGKKLYVCLDCRTLWTNGELTDGPLYSVPIYDDVNERWIQGSEVSTLDVDEENDDEA